MTVLPRLCFLGLVGCCAVCSVPDFLLKFTLTLKQVDSSTCVGRVAAGLPAFEADIILIT